MVDMGSEASTGLTIEELRAERQRLLEERDVFMEQAQQQMLAYNGAVQMIDRLITLANGTGDDVQEAESETV